MEKDEWTNERWYLNLKHAEKDAETWIEYQAACEETDKFVDTHNLNWQVVGALINK